MRRRSGWICLAIAALIGCDRGSDAERPSATTRSPTAAARDVAPVVPSTVLIAYYSRTGHTEEMARAVAAGAGEVSGVVVQVKAAADVTARDLESAGGLVLGSPTHFANIPADMKAILDRWSTGFGVDLTDKVGGAFATGGNLTGGKEHVVVSLLLYMLNNRMVVAGPIYRDGDSGWGELGASATTGADDPGLSAAELAGARRLGARVAGVVRRLRE